MVKAWWFSMRSKICSGVASEPPQVVHITLDPGLPFTDSVGGMFPGPATTQTVYQGIA